MASTVLQLSPYVAASIVEHVKRRGTAAGYLIGMSDADSITVTDFVPLTHKDTASLMGNNPVVKEMATSRHAALKHYTGNSTLVGWYAAGNPQAAETDEANFTMWSEAPSAMFVRGTGRLAVMLLVTSPTPEKVAVTWEAFLTRNVYNRNAEGKIESVNCERVSAMDVKIEAETMVMNSVLADVVSKAFYHNGVPYVTSRVNNIDHVAFEAEFKNDDEERALISVQHTMLEAVAEARNLASGGAPSRNPHGIDVEDSKEIMEAYEAFRAEYERLEGKSYNEDAFKDALMIKYYTTLLRRQVLELERLCKFEKKEPGKPQELQSGPGAAAEAQA